MGTALEKALALILSCDRELIDILSVTAQMSVQSTIIALLIGVPIGVWLGTFRFPGRSVLLVVNRTLMGMPPVVCGLMFYMLFSGVGPFRHLQLLFTVEIMILAQVALITPIVIGNMETYVAGISPAVRETAHGLQLGKMKTFQRMRVSDLFSVSARFCSINIRSWCSFNGWWRHCLENKRHDNCDHAIYQSRKFFAGYCAWYHSYVGIASR